MVGDRKAFRERFKAWKNGKQPYSAGKIVKLEDGKEDTILPELIVEPTQSQMMLSNLVLSLAAANAKKQRDAKLLHSKMHEARSAAIAPTLGLYGLAMAPVLGSATTAMAKTLSPGSPFWMNPITKLMAASTLGGTILNGTTKAISGKTWDEHTDNTIELLTGWNPSNDWYGGLVSGIFNPGYYTPYGAVSGGISKAVNQIDNIKSILKNPKDAMLSGLYDTGIWTARNIGGTRLRNAMYRNIAPLGYKMSYLGEDYSKIDEFKNAIKDFFNPKLMSELRTKNVQPLWKDEVNEHILNTVGIEDGGNIRNEIYRMYLGIPVKNKYYYPTDRIDAAGNTIYSYATEYGNRQIPMENMQRAVDDASKNINKFDIGNDMLGSSGGVVKHGLFSSPIQNVYTYKYKDVFDVNPFKNPARGDTPAFGLLLSKYSTGRKPRFVLKLLKFEMSDLVKGGHPVTVETEFPIKRIKFYDSTNLDIMLIPLPRVKGTIYSRVWDRLHDKYPTSLGYSRDDVYTQTARITDDILKRHPELARYIAANSREALNDLHLKHGMPIYFSDKLDAIHDFNRLIDTFPVEISSNKKSITRLDPTR